MKRKNDETLTVDEVAFLRSDRVPDMVKAFVARQHETVGVRTSAYRKVAAAAKAERQALMEVALLNLARAKAGHPVELVESTLGHDTDVQAELQELRRELTRLRAMPALAVHGD